MRWPSCSVCGPLGSSMLFPLVVAQVLVFTVCLEAGSSLHPFCGSIWGVDAKSPSHSRAPGLSLVT